MIPWMLIIIGVVLAIFGMRRGKRGITAVMNGADSPMKDSIIFACFVTAGIFFASIGFAILIEGFINFANLF